VINVYDIDHEGEASFYTMELLDGARLSEVLQPGGAWPLPHALAVIRDIGAAVAHAHSRGIVHGDLKPQNVFIMHDGQVRVLDFGGTVAAEPWIGNPTAMPEFSSAQARIQAHRLDEPYGLGPFLAATPAYASCEQLEGQPADPRDDLYALACIAYQLLAGRHPFDGRSSLQARALRLRPTRPRALRADAWRALRQALAFDRAQRSFEIDAWLRDLGVAQAIEHLPPHWPQRASMVKERPVVRLAATAAVLLIGVAAIGWLLQQQGALDVTGLMNAPRDTLRAAWQQIQARSSNALGLNPPATAIPNEPLGGPASQAPPPAPAPNPPPTTNAPAALQPQNGSGAQASAAAPATSSASSIAGATGNAASAPTGADTTSAPIMPMSSVPAAAAGVTFSATRYDVSGHAPAARIVIRRVGNTSDDVPFVWWTEADSAKPDVDYAPLGRRVELIPKGKHNVTIFVPIISNPLRQQPTQFYVALGELPDSGEVRAPSERATVMIAPTG
jgi:serine/threonine protein kinase